MKSQIQQEIETKDYKEDGYYYMLKNAQQRSKLLCENDSYPVGTKILLLWNGLGKVYGTKVNDFLVNLVFIGHDKKRRVRSEVCDCDVHGTIEVVQNQ